MNNQWYSGMQPAEVGHIRQGSQRKLMWHICKLDGVNSAAESEQQAARDAEERCFKKASSLEDYGNRIAKKLQRLALAFQEKYGKSIEDAKAEDRARAAAAAASPRATEAKNHQPVRRGNETGTASRSPRPTAPETRMTPSRPAPPPTVVTTAYRERFAELMAWVVSHDGQGLLAELLESKPQHARRVKSFLARAKELQGVIATKRELGAQDAKVVQQLHQLRQFIENWKQNPAHKAKRRVQTRGKYPEGVQRGYASMVERLWPSVYSSLDAGVVRIAHQDGSHELDIGWLLSYIREALDDRVELSVSCVGTDTGPTVVQKRPRNLPGLSGADAQRPANAGAPQAPPYQSIIASSLASVQLGLGALVAQFRLQPVAAPVSAGDHLFVDFRKRVVCFELRTKREVLVGNGMKRRRLAAFQNDFMLPKPETPTVEAALIDPAEQLRIWSHVAQEQLREWLVTSQGYGADVTTIGLHCENLTRVCQWLQNCLFSLDQSRDVSSIPRIPSFQAFRPILNSLNLRIQ